MKSAVEKLNPTKVKVTVDVAYDELKPSIDAAYKTIGSQIQIPGFRKGHVPARIIDQRVGRGAVLQDAVNESLPGFFSQALREQEIRAIGEPAVEVTAVPGAEGEELSFTIETEVRPDIELPDDLESLQVEVDPIVVTDEDVDRELTQLRERFGALVGVDREVEQGDFVSIDLSATIGGEDIDAVTGVSYEVGSGTMLPGLDEAVIGLKVDDTAEFTAPLAGGDRAGEAADCVVTVRSVKVRELPELDDEFAQLASEFDTLDELRASVTKQVEQAKKFAQGTQARDKILDHLVETMEVPLPEGVIEAEINSHLEGEGRLEDDEHRAEVDEQTRRALKVQFILDAIAEDREVSVEQEELIEYLVITAQQYGMDANQFAQMVDQQNQIPAIIGEVSRRKALASLLDDATITDTNGQVVDLDELVPDDESGEHVPDEQE